MLAWLDGKLDAATDPARFAAFQARAKAELKLDPAKVTRQRAATRLLKQNDGWAPIWSRFVSSAPEMHEPLVTLLTAQDPPDPLLADPTVYPNVNLREEADLRAALLAFRDKSAAQAAKEVFDLERRHGRRREGPWAARGLTPLATAVGHLAGLSNTAPLPAGDPQVLAAAYAAEGWQADWCALAALNATLPSRTLGALSTAAEDRVAVTAALRALYLPRLQREAALLQDLLRAGVPQSQPRGEVDTLLFVDGLRMDLAQRLAMLLCDSGATVDVGWRWAGFPTVTATCKPLATPAAGRFRGGAADGYAPITADGKTVGQVELLRELAAAGWQSGESLLPGEKCWMEAGHVDHDGHKLQERLADQLPAMLQDIAPARVAWRSRGGGCGS